jgi:cytochrome c biogenesis protein CcdA
MSSALQLDRRLRWSLYAAFALLFATGAVWLLADQLKDSPDSELWQATAANMLMVHGGAAMLTLLLIGALFPIHVARAWRGRLNRISGSIMVLCNAVLILTAFGLYYLGAETLRPWASDVHMAAGFALPVLIAVHIWLGRRQSNNRAPARSAKPVPK